IMDAKKEEQIIDFWQKKKIYKKLKDRKGKSFYFLDGPPYATGSIHLGTAWNKILKDSYIRFWRMRGFNVWDQPGYDTHGLPIENKVEKEFQIKSKTDIEKLGIEKFIIACRNFATKYIDVMSNQFANLGVWMDWSNPYITLNNSYIEGAWHTFKIAYDKGFLYRGLYPVHVCPHCETSVAYNEIEYAKVTDTAIYVKFPVKGKQNEFLVIWTTTPWTLPANTGVMAKPDADYVKVKVDGQILIVAKDLHEALMQKIGTADYHIVDTMKGKDLAGLEYEYPMKDLFEFQRSLKNAHRVVLSDQFVTLDTGTGLVHTAPGHGQEDFKVGIENKLPALSPVNLNGTFDHTCGELSGIFVKAADRIIIDKLKGRGLILFEEKIIHDYPQCWRCNTPLLLISVSQWFFKVTKIRQKLLAENKKVNWQPKWAGQRFDNWLENLSDWPISRQRYWGIPLPIWICEQCKYVRVIGSTKELGHSVKDLHRPYIDSVTLKCKCKGTMKRIPDVLDVWFDSGLASWSSLGYPASRTLFNKLWPADLNIEGPDQIRGWWNSQLITSVITFDRAPFRNIIFHGFVLDARGIKMAKSVGNIVAPEEVVQKYGRDVLRFYLLNSPAWDDFYFKWADVEVVAKSFVVIENTFNFIKTYVTKIKKATLKPEDRWILSKMNSLIDSCTKSGESYNIHKCATETHDFLINDFSRWYIKLIRDRVWPAYNGKDKQAAFYTLYEVAKNIATLMAPITPFLAERVQQDVLKPLGDKAESVHLKAWPVVNKRLVDKNLENSMLLVQEISEIVSSLRKECNIKLRWPIEKIIIETKDAKVKKSIKQLKGVLRRSTNAKVVLIDFGEEGFAVKDFSKGKVYVSKKILKTEALLRELLREIQEQRKKRKLIISNKIVLFIDNDEMKQFAATIKEKVGAKEVIFGSVEEEFAMVKVEDDIVRFKFSLVK
ncbi:MAG: isoleucine--tRNA ligase, partial [Candidatus Aenigmarchaeota archaeon]|nr:isoleucine--tRNA ligase [Candidatus Aenigmarchaeota archaeon]